MCTQTYLRFACCPCQLRYRFEPCAHGPADPRCRGVRAALVRAGRDFCHHHRWLLKQSSAWHAQQIRLRVLSLSSLSSSSSPSPFPTDGGSGSGLAGSGGGGNYHHYYYFCGGGGGGSSSSSSSSSSSAAVPANVASGTGGAADAAAARAFGLDIHANHQPAMPTLDTGFRKRY